MTHLDIAYIDDDQTYASTVVDLLREYLGVAVETTDDPDKFLAWLESRNVLVAVVDQRMPRRSGLEILEEIAKRNIPVRRVMLTGEATPNEVALAFKAGLSDHVDKKRVLDVLPGVLTEQMLRQQLDLARLSLRSESLPVVHVKSRFPLYRRRVSYVAISGPRLVKRSAVDASQYRTYAYLEAGAAIAAEASTEWSKRTELVSELELEGTQVASVTVKALLESHAEISNRVKLMTRGTIEWVERRSVKFGRTIAAPPLPTNPTELHVSARGFEIAPAYDIYESVWRGLCVGCNYHHVIVTRTYMNRGEISLRQIDRWSDGTQKELETLIIDAIRLPGATWN